MPESYSCGCPPVLPSSFDATQRRCARFPALYHTNNRYLSGQHSEICFICRREWGDQDVALVHIDVNCEVACHEECWVGIRVNTKRYQCPKCSAPIDEVRRDGSGQKEASGKVDENEKNTLRICAMTTQQRAEMVYQLRNQHKAPIADTIEGEARSVWLEIGKKAIYRDGPWNGRHWLEALNAA